jgi:hypothetical protein
VAKRLLLLHHTHISVFILRFVENLRMKTEMVFETLVATKTEPPYPTDSPKELLH